MTDLYLKNIAIINNAKQRQVSNNKYILKYEKEI